jgi:hypothetical protein
MLIAILPFAFSLLRPYNHYIKMERGGWDLWMKWETILRAAGYAKHRGDLDLLEADGGRHLGFTRLVARQKGE